MSNTKLVKLGKKGHIVIPKALRDSIGVKEGNLLLITVESGQLLITTPERYAEATRGLLKGLWGRNPEEVESYLKEQRESWD